MKLYQSGVSFLLCLVLTTCCLAEGTKQVAPNASIVIDGTNTSDIAALLINHTEYNRFATYNNNDPNSRLYIHIANPGQECIYMGFSGGHTNQNGTSVSNINYEYRIKDPNGNIVYGPIVVNVGDQNINTWDEAVIGPSVLFGIGGYNAISASSADLMSQGWSGAGDYYIEFLNTTSSAEVLIDFWDITVATCTAAPDTPKPGRVWSYNWAFFAVNDFGFPVRPFNGSFHVCAPDPDDVSKAFITKIDFDGSGFMPAAFNVAFNSFGSRNTGDVAIDRRSAENQNATQSEYAIFLNDPIDLCQTAQAGEITLVGISRCSQEDYCVQFITSKEGQVDLLLDFDGSDNIYTPGTADVLISRIVEATEVGVPTCLSWNGLNGLGVPMDESTSTTIPITIAFAQGIYHFPIYDAEFMENGFNISAVRPSGPVPQLYYDDSQISVPSGSGEPPVQLAGCNLPCHRWNNYTDGNTVGFGNLNTINSWWFSQLVIETELLLLPALYTCDVTGPDTICGDATETLNLSLNLLPAGATSPPFVSQNWAGPGIIGPTTGNQIEVEMEGTYSIEIAWTNNLGDTCRTSCSKTIVGVEDCCELRMTCLPSSIWHECNDTIPTPAQTIDELINLGLLQVEDISCGNLKMASTTTTANSGCLGDPQETIYHYDVWNDANNNDLIDSDELLSQCQQVFLSIDTILPTIEFTGDLAGFTSGDTMYIECRAADPDWSIPAPSVDDVLAFDVCNDFTIELSDVVEEAGNCEAEGFVKFYTCSWVVTDLCGNTDTIILYMALIDNTPPAITDIAPDVTITCLDEMPAPYSSATDACNCAHMELGLDTVAYRCESDFKLKRSYTWTDHCGNATVGVQFVTVSDDGGINLTLPNDWFNGAQIEVECENGTIPFSIAELDANSAIASAGCSPASIRYQFAQLEGDNCATGYMAKYRLEWVATNDCGHLSMSEVFINLVDHQAPVIISYPTPDCTGLFNPFDIVIKDNCGIATIEYDQVLLESTCHNKQNIKYIWNIFDHCGNRTYGEQIIQEGDNTPPVINLDPPYENIQSGARISLPCGPGGLPDLSGLANISDSCSVQHSITYVVDQTEEINCLAGHNGVYRLQWIAKDACGNESVFVLFVEIEAPDLSKLIEDDIVEMVCGDDIPTPSLNHCVADIRELGRDISSVCDGTLSYIAYEIIGQCGQQLADTLWMQLKDEEPPVFDEIPSTICVRDDLPVARAWDACEQRYIPVSVYERRELICGLPLTVLTFSAIDDCGNEARHDLTIVPLNLELNFELYYDDLALIEGSDGWPTLTMNCPFELDVSKFRLTPDCDLTAFIIDVAIADENCSNSDLYEKMDYIIQLSTTCGVVSEYHLQVELLDDQAPIFLAPPMDMTLSCYDSLILPEIEFWEACSEVAIVTDQIVITSIPGQNSYMQSWTATDACGNVANHDRIVTRFEAPICDIVVPDDVLCHSLQRLESLVTGGIAPYHFEWKVLQGNCELISSSGQEAYIDLIIFSGLVEVELTVTDALGCSSTCIATFECVDKPGLDGNPLTLSLSPVNSEVVLYPNPTQSVLNFYSNEVVAAISIINTQGKEVLKTNVNSQSGILDVSSLNFGIYLVKITDALGLERVHKIMVW